MKQLSTYYLLLLLLLPLSCKSHKDVSRNSMTQTRGESLVSVSDSTEAHRETSLSEEATTTEEASTYTREREFDGKGNVVKERETIYLLNLQVDFKKQLDEIKREDFRYNATVTASDTTSHVASENIEEGADSRPVQGVEWLFVIVGLIWGGGLLIAIYKMRRIR